MAPSSPLYVVSDSRPSYRLSQQLASAYKGLRELQEDHPEVKRRIVISLERRSRITNDRIEVLTYKDFVEKLWSNKLF